MDFCELDEEKMVGEKCLDDIFCYTGTQNLDHEGTRGPVTGWEVGCCI